ncbi:MAG: phosphoribosylpyrophosphate synthetase [Flavisolibacter sp.]
MYNYGSALQAIDDLRQRGYTEDFNLAENCMICRNEKYNVDDFEIREVYRFEGDSNPDDESVVYGIESKSGVKGILVNGYGYSAEPMSAEIARKLKIDAHR